MAGTPVLPEVVPPDPPLAFVPVPVIPPDVVYPPLPPEPDLPVPAPLHDGSRPSGAQMTSAARTRFMTILLEVEVSRLTRRSLELVSQARGTAQACGWGAAFREAVPKSRSRRLLGGYWSIIELPRHRRMTRLAAAGARDGKCPHRTVAGQSGWAFRIIPRARTTIRAVTLG